MISSRRGRWPDGNALLRLGRRRTVWIERERAALESPFMADPYEVIGVDPSPYNARGTIGDIHRNDVGAGSGTAVLWFNQEIVGPMSGRGYVRKGRVNLDQSLGPGCIVYDAPIGLEREERTVSSEGIRPFHV